MKKEITYIANDGKKFDNEYDCRKYEQKQKSQKIQAVQEELCRLDDLLWSMFYPNDTELNTADRKLFVAYLWLTNDIQHILLDPQFDREESENKILEVIHSSKYGAEILEKNISWEGISKNVELRSDFEQALKNVKDGSDLSSDLSYCLSSLDLKRLATLHKARKYRKKIENLLTNCNFHKECGDFINGNYDEYLK